MIKIHKLEDGDIIKILPMIDKNDKISWIKKYDCVGLDTRVFICDNSGKGYLKRISHKLREQTFDGNFSSGYLGPTKLPISTKYAMNIYINGEIRILNVGRILFKMITDNPELWDIKGNHQIFVVRKEVSVVGLSANGQMFPTFENSYVSEKGWIPPVSNVNSKEEWFSYIKSNQPDFDNHLEKNNLFSHKQSLINYLGKDMLGDLISDDRQKKLVDLLE